MQIISAGWGEIYSATMSRTYPPTIPSLCLPVCLIAYVWPSPTPIYRRLLRTVDLL